MKIKTTINLLVGGMVLAAFANVLAQTTFTKITESDFVNDLGGFVGAAWGDFDNDGLLDVFLSHYGGANAFYRNNGSGMFTKITQAPPVQDDDTHTIPAWGDYDNDGNLDLLVPAGLLASSSTNAKLFHNNGVGMFASVSGGDLTVQLGHFAGGWVDYNNDGFLDVLLSDIPSNEGGTRLLFRNNGDGIFTSIAASPLTTDISADFAHLWADYDNDGFVDLFIVNNKSQTANLLYRNDRKGVFTRVLTGNIATDRGSENCNGGAWGDYDNDGFLDLFVATSFEGSNRFYHNNANGTFTRITSGPMLSRPGGGDSITCAWGDYDNDGYLDLFVANSGARNQLFRNNGSGTFAQILSGAPVEDGGPGIYCSGTSWVDYDNDGFLDLLVLEGGDNGSLPKLLYHNNGNSNSWLEVKCVGTVSNRQGIGAKVRAQATIGGKTFWQMREIRTGAGYNTAPLVAHFGLGDSKSVQVLRIEWPSGSVQEIRDVEAKQILSITEPARLEPQFTVASSSVELKIKSWSGFVYGVDTSSDLRNWTRITTLTNLTGALQFTDPGAPNSARRFYRVVSP